MDCSMTRRELVHWVADHYPSDTKLSATKVSRLIFGNQQLSSFMYRQNGFLSKGMVRDLLLVFPDMPEKVRKALRMYERPANKSKALFQQHPKVLVVGKRYRFVTVCDEGGWSSEYEGVVSSEYRRFYLLERDTYPICILKNDLIGSHAYEKIQEI